MALGYSITVKNSAPEVLARAAALVGPQRLHEAMALEGKVTTQRHLIKLNSERKNPLGGRRSHFYARFARDTHAQADEKKASVVTGNADFGSDTQGNPLWKKYIGGDIHAKPGKALSVPVHAQAYAQAPRSISGLSLIVFGPKKIAALVKLPQVELKYTTRKDGTVKPVKKQTKMTLGEVFYLLLKRIRLKADKSVLPSEADYEAAGLRALSRVLRFGGRLA